MVLALRCGIAFLPGGVGGAAATRRVALSSDFLRTNCTSSATSSTGTLSSRSARYRPGTCTSSSQALSIENTTLLLSVTPATSVHAGRQGRAGRSVTVGRETEVGGRAAFCRRQPFWAGSTSIRQPPLRPRSYLVERP